MYEISDFLHFAMQISGPPSSIFYLCNTLLGTEIRINIRISYRQK